MGVKKHRKTGDTDLVLVSKIPLRLNHEQRILIDRLRQKCAELWNDILELHWWLYDTYKIWSDDVEKKKWFNAKTHHLHAQTIQAIIELHHETCERIRELRKKGETQWKYPYKHKMYFSVRYKKIALSIESIEGKDYLRLSNGRNEEPLVIPYPRHIEFSRITNAEIVWKHGRYWLHLGVKQDARPKVRGDGIAGGDVGEIHAITLSDGVHHQIITGRELRSLHRLRNKRLRWFQKRISRTQKGSKNRIRLYQKKQKFLDKIHRKIEYILHCISKMTIDWCMEHGVTILYIGNPQGVQLHTKNTRRVSRKVRQKLSNWSFGRLIQMIEYKAYLYGITIKCIEESYTSGSCTSCGIYSKQQGRIFSCPHCGATGHRDVIGVVNIREKGQTGELTGGREIPDWKDVTYRRVRWKTHQAVA